MYETICMTIYVYRYNICMYIYTYIFTTVIFKITYSEFFICSLEPSCIQTADKIPKDITTYIYHGDK